MLPAFCDGNQGIVPFTYQTQSISKGIQHTHRVYLKETIHHVAIAFILWLHW